MTFNPGSLVSALKFGELRTSGVSWEVEPGGMSRTLRVDRLAVQDVDVQSAAGSLRASTVELSNVVVRAPWSRSAPGPQDPPSTVVVEELRLKDASVATAASPPKSGGAPGHWRLEPLAALDGTLHADIVDAAWIFDADVTIPIASGRVDFNRATVEHIGPDSSMGISRMGVYVDAPNGRTYLFLLTATHVPGVRFERRSGGLLPGWSGDRGAVDLRPLLECVLTGMPLGTLATGVRDMVSRTSVRGELRLGDGVVGDDRHRIVLTGRDQGRNHLAVSLTRSDSGSVLRMPALSAGELRWESSGMVVSAGTLSATLSVRIGDALAERAVSVSIVELTLRDVVAEASRRTA